MDTSNQFAVFSVCLFIGFIGGIAYEPFGLVRVCFACGRGKNKILGAICDVAFWIVFALLCTVGAYIFHFPAFRAYMWLGYALGGILYLKILHKIIAFFENVCYNKVTHWIKKAKNREKTLKRKTGKRL